MEIHTNTILGPARDLIQTASYNASYVFLVNSYGSCDHSIIVSSE